MNQSQNGCASIFGINLKMAAHPFLEAIKFFKNASKFQCDLRAAIFGSRYKNGCAAIFGSSCFLMHVRGPSKRYCLAHARDVRTDCKSVHVVVTQEHNTGVCQADSHTTIEILQVLYNLCTVIQAAAHTDAARSQRHAPAKGSSGAQA